MTDADGAQPAVLVERRGNVLVITINRPEARNAINAPVSIGVGDALQEAQHDPDVRAVVITGAGDKSFCAGADLKAIAVYLKERGSAGTPSLRSSSPVSFSHVASLISTSVSCGLFSDSIRAAAFTVSPIAVQSSRPLLPIAPTTTRPV